MPTIRWCFMFGSDSGDMEMSPSGRSVRQMEGRHGEEMEIGIPIQLEKLVKYTRKELLRLQDLDDDVVKKGTDNHTINFGSPLDDD